MQKGAALRPGFFGNLPSLMSKLADEKGVSDEEQHLAALSTQTGWRIIAETADNLIQELDRVNEQAIANGATREQIGDNAIVISLAKGIIRRLIQKVEDAVEACQKPDGTEK